MPIGGGAGELTLELVRPDQLAERLATLAFRAPDDEFERAASPGLQAVFTGPDRRAKDVPTRLIHEWDARRAKMVRWAYTLAGKADPGDWVSRRPQVIHGVTPQRYRDHLLWRFKKRTPGL